MIEFKIGCLFKKNIYKTVNPDSYNFYGLLLLLNEKLFLLLESQN